MRRIVDRHQTFTEYWPSERIEADLTLLADARFYYLGEGDWMKCWYCNDGFKNWDRFDNPWIENVKWFSLSEYLLKNKGMDFVKDIVKGFIDLKRPAEPNPLPENKLQGLQRLVKNKPPAKQQPPFLPFIDPRECEDVKEKVDRKMLLGRNVEMAKLLGFQDQKITQTLTKRFTEHGENFTTSTILC